MRRLLVGVLATGLMASAPSPGAGAPPDFAAAPAVLSAEHHDLSPPLREIPAEPAAEPPSPVFREVLRQPLPKRGPKPLLPDPVVQSSPEPPLMPSAAGSFDGLGNLNGVLPPDPNGDVGPNHYVQWVNLSFAVYDKSGTLVYGPAAGNTLWAGFGGPCQTRNDGDPIVRFDALAQRWLLSQFALPSGGPFYQCIAISQTDDPTGAYYRYAFQISATKLNDYPKFGVWPDAYYMTANQFIGNTWAGQAVVAFERDKMLAGLPANMVYFDLFGVDPNLGGMLPSDLDGPPPPTGTPNYYVQFDDDASGYPQDQLEVWEFSVDWTNPAASTFTLQGTLATAAFDSNMCGYSRNCIPQPGHPTRKVDAISDRLMYRLQYRNFGTHQTLVVNHTVDVDGTDHAGIRWYELRQTTGPWSIYQQGTYAPDSEHRWMGSMAMDGSGNIALGFSLSSTTTFPSIHYTGRLDGDPLGLMTQGEGSLVAGAGSQQHSSGRWGDYSMMAVDPTDDCTFWYTQEYYASTSLAGWKTRIGSFKFPSCGIPPGSVTLTVNKAGNGSGTVTPTSSPPGTPCGLGCTAYPSGTEVTLSTAPAGDSDFTGWSGGGCSGTGTCVITLTANTTVTATFVLKTFNLTVVRVGNGTVTSAPPGINCGATCVAGFTTGTPVTLTATAAADSTFTGWSGACTGGGTCMVTVTADTMVTATFALKPVLTVTPAGTGSGTVTSSPPGINCGATCAAAYTSGTPVTLTATAAANSTFTGWSGGGCSGALTCMVTVTADTPVTATFALKPVLTVSRAGTGSGTVTSSPPGINCGGTCAAAYTSGTPVTLTATPAANSDFTGWSGGGCVGISTCIVTVTADTTVTATFTLKTFTLTVDRVGTGSGTVTSAPPGIDCGGVCSTGVLSGNSLTLTASAAPGSTFTGWSGGGCGGTGQCVVTVTTNVSVTAGFSLTPPSTFTLHVNKLGTGSGTVTSSPPGIDCGGLCATSFVSGASVTLTAVAAPGSTFTGWSGGGCNGTGPCSLNLVADTVVTAGFAVGAPSSFTLTVLAAGSGSGTITSSPPGIQCGGTCAGTFPSGTVVTLTATPAPGSLAAGWSGAPCGGLTSCTLTMIADATVTGSFVVVPANLVTVGVDQSAFSPGQTLVASAGLNDPGLPAVVDFYLGLLLPDGDTVVLLTPGGFALGRLSDLTTLQPIVAGMSLAAPLTVAVPSAFAHTWTSTDPAGGYVLFLGAVLSGGLADGLLAPGELLGVATAPFLVTP